MITHNTPCPISQNDIVLSEMKHLSGNLYLWDSEIEKDQDIQVRIRVGRTKAYIESYEVNPKTPQSQLN